MTLKQSIREERIAAKQREVVPWVDPPPCNPWQYSQAKSSYPADPGHIDFRDPKRFDRTRLHQAVLAKDRSLVQALLDQGANPWVVDRNGRTPIDVARGYLGDKEVEACLKDRMDAILAQCAAYEREAGKKLGLRSQRRKRQGSRDHRA